MAEPTCIPSMGPDEDGADRWMSQHLHFVGDAKDKDPDVVFIGDSLIQHFQFTEVWQRHVEPLHCLNFGIHDDKLQNILWRVMNGEMEGFSPKAVVLMGGSHNNGSSAEAIVDGILEIVKEISIRQGKAQIIVVGLLPCGALPNPKRERHLAVNALLAERLREMAPSVVYIQPDWEQFLMPETSQIKHCDMFDYMHPTEQTYSKLMEPIVEELQNLLQTFPKAGAPVNVHGDE